MNAAASQRLSARVTGLVQGVNFRHFTRTRARALGLAGWVRNEADGAVRLVAEGPRSLLEQLLEAVRVGPSSAHVRHVEAHWGEATGEFNGFSVRF